MTPQVFDVKIYKSGNSKVFTIPAGAPIDVGDVFEMTISPKEVSLKKKKSEHTTEKKIQSLTDAFQILNTPNLTRGMNPGELDEFLEGVYD